MKYLFVFILATITLSQTQQKIEWPSLANSSWPVIRGDMQGTGRSKYIGPEKYNIKWTADIFLGILKGPVLGFDNTLFFGTNSIPADLSHNYFYAYNPDSTKLWEYETPNAYPSKFAPVISSDSTVYVMSNDGNLYALNFSGTLKWTYFLEQTATTEISLDKKGYLYIYANGKLQVIKPDGSLYLSKEFPNFDSDISFSPDGETIYFTVEISHSPSEYHFIAADLQGNIKWEIPGINSDWIRPAVDNNGNIYIFTRSTGVYLTSLTSSGEERWRYPVNPMGDVSPSIDIDGNIICSGFADPNSNKYSLFSISPGGSLNWKYLLDYNDEPGGIITDAKGNIFFGSTMGTYFQAFNNKGELLWKMPLNNRQFDSSPAIGSDGTLYIGTHINTMQYGLTDDLIAVDNGISGINDNLVTSEFYLSQNFPNPFNPQTKINYSVPSLSFVSLKVYDILGNEIATLVNEGKPIGHYSVSFNANKFTSGVYFYTLRSGQFTETKKLILLK